MRGRNPGPGGRGRHYRQVQHRVRQGQQQEVRAQPRYQVPSSVADPDPDVLVGSGSVFCTMRNRDKIIIKSWIRTRFFGSSLRLNILIKVQILKNKNILSNRVGSGSGWNEGRAYILQGFFPIHFQADFIFLFLSFHLFLFLFPSNIL